MNHKMQEKKAIGDYMNNQIPLYKELSDILQVMHIINMENYTLKQLSNTVPEFIIIQLPMKIFQHKCQLAFRNTV